MPSENVDTEILKRLDRIEKHLEAKSTRTWIKVGIVRDLTGWDKEAMRKARDNGLVKQRNGSNGIEYLLESINPIFIKQTVISGLKEPTLETNHDSR